jgi:Lipase (class 3)
VKILEGKIMLDARTKPYDSLILSASAIFLLYLTISWFQFPPLINAFAVKIGYMSQRTSERRFRVYPRKQKSHPYTELDMILQNRNPQIDPESKQPSTFIPSSSVNYLNNLPNFDDLNNDEEADDFSSWIVSNFKQWPLLNSGDGVDSNCNTSFALDEFLNAETLGRNVSEASSYLRSPLSQVFNIETLIQMLVPSVLSPTSTMSTTPAKNVMNWSAWDDNILSVNTVAASIAQSTGKSADSIIKQTVARIETMVTDASSAVSPETVVALIRKASELTRLSPSTNTINGSSSIADPTLPSAPIDALSTVESSNPVAAVRETTITYASSLLSIADGLFRKGYVNGDPVSAKIMKQSKSDSYGGTQSILKYVPKMTGSRALFDEFESVEEVNVLSSEFTKAAEMGALAGAIYQETLPRTHSLRHTIVACNTTADVMWMVSDGIANRSSFVTTATKADEAFEQLLLVRTITIRGFDASDESVDRERLLNRVCTANPVPLYKRSSTELVRDGILVHSGLLSIAQEVYSDIKQYVNWTASSHRIVLNGHSIGGSIAILVLLLMIQDYGIDFVRNYVLQVYTFGSPPVSVMQHGAKHVDVLSAMDLPTDLVQGFVQPWDPIVRLFSVIDSLYPLVSDLGTDNCTPFANGPPRTLRPILKSIIVSWDGWPRFRDNYQGTANQNYTSLGVQHLLLPDPTRYLADRFLAVNIPVPPIETIVRISSDELYPALSSVFPLDVFEVSFVPQAIRSFVHHFYPAYGFPLVDYVKELQRRSRDTSTRLREFSFSENEALTTTRNGNGVTEPGGIDWGKAAQWLIRNDANS